ncbi:Serine/threonine-protein phosphatase 6 regulatory ankyrin repeat subunit, partial [Globisporangium polare]
SSNNSAVKILRFTSKTLSDRFKELDFEIINAAVAGNDQASRPPWLIHTYELKQTRSSRLGTGAFGEVFKAVWRDTPVVVKMMGYEVDADASSRELFFHELRVWFPLIHPHVIRMYGACHVSKRFFVCEFAGNGTLSAYLKREKEKTDAVDRSWQLLSQVALGLQYLHEHNILHNDLKGDNVLIGTAGEAKITDFGLSCILKSAEVVIDPEKRGALQWKSPEYIRGDRLTLASDIYALGMCIVEALTGEPPWGRQTTDFSVRIHQKKGKLPLQPECLSETHWALVQMMCTWDPAQRMKISFVADKLHEFAQQQ